MLSRLFFHDRPARPGDLVWPGRDAGIRDADAGLSFVTVWFPRMAAQGSARVQEDGLLFWSRRVHVDALPRPLTALGRALPWDRPGQALVSREAASARPNKAPLPPAPPGTFAKARGGLPLVRAFGGRSRGYLGL